MTTDPVCGLKVDERKAEATSEYLGQKYYFCSEACKKQFDKEPARYAEEKSGRAGGR